MALDLRKPKLTAEQAYERDLEENPSPPNEKREYTDLKDAASRKALFRFFATCLGRSHKDLSPVLGMSVSSLNSFSAKSHALAPLDDILELMYEMVDIEVESSLRLARNLERQHCFTQKEFLSAITTEFNLRFEKVRDDLAVIRIPGRGGFIGLLWLDNNQKSSGDADAASDWHPGMPYQEALDIVSKKAWRTYNRWIQSGTMPENPLETMESRKNTLSWLVPRLNLPRQRLADTSGRTLSAINAWLGPRANSSPPAGVVEDLIWIHANWAVEYRLQRISLKKDILEWPVPSVPVDWVFNTNNDDDPKIREMPLFEPENPDREGGN